MDEKETKFWEAVWSIWQADVTEAVPRHTPLYLKYACQDVGLHFDIEKVSAGEVVDELAALLFD